MTEHREIEAIDQYATDAFSMVTTWGLIETELVAALTDFTSRIFLYYEGLAAPLVAYSNALVGDALGSLDADAETISLFRYITLDAKVQTQSHPRGGKVRFHVRHSGERGFWSRHDLHP